MSATSKPVRSAFAAALLICLSAGCGGEAELPKAEVDGEVRVGDELLEAGSITFTPTGETPGPATTVGIAAGQFAFPKQNGPAVGEHEVTIRPADPAAPEFDAEPTPEELRAAAAKQKPSPLTKPATFPETVKDGPNHFAFELPAGG